MQAFRRSSTIAASTLRAQRARPLSTSSVRLDDAAKKPDGAQDSMKRGAQNTGSVLGQAGRLVMNTIKDMGDAAKEIASDGRAEGKTTRQHAGQMMRDRVSGSNKKEKKDE